MGQICGPNRQDRAIQYDLLKTSNNIYRIRQWKASRQVTIYFIIMELFRISGLSLPIILWAPGAGVDFLFRSRCQLVRWISTLNSFFLILCNIQLTLLEFSPSPPRKQRIHTESPQIEQPLYLKFFPSHNQQLTANNPTTSIKSSSSLIMTLTTSLYSPIAILFFFTPRG